MGVGMIIAKVLLSILLVVGIFGFVASVSVSQEINEDSAEEIISEVGAEIISEEIAERGKVSAEDKEEFVYSLKEECEIQEGLELGDSGIVVDCDEIEGADSDEIEEIIQEEIEGQIEKNVAEQLEVQEIGKHFVLVNLGAWIFGILSMVFAVVLFFLNSPKYKFLINFGLVGIIAGAPFFVTESVANSINFEIGAINSVAIKILENVHFGLFMVFALGIVFVIVGFGWMFFVRRKND